MRKTYEEKKIASLKSPKKGVGSGVGFGAGSGSIRQRCGTNQNVMDPQRWLVGFDKCKHLERF
jgi:hypothetical protein